MTLFGYFDHSSQVTPAFDPGPDVDCLFCAKPLAAPMRTVSVMSAEHPDRSYFYRVHRACDEALSEDEKSLYDVSVLR